LTEGFTTHFSNVIAFRAGLLSIDELLESLNDIATRHFDDKLASATSDELQRAFQRDHILTTVPYTRGTLYAAELDGALRSASRSKRTLDEVVRELYQQSRRQGSELPADAIRRVVRNELGRPGVERYDAVIVHGHDPDPPSDAYGPCFARKPRAPTGFAWVRVLGVPDAQCRQW
jgi:predicted metalloprotease with PDZ domain